MLLTIFFTLIHRNNTIQQQEEPMNTTETKEPCCGTDCCSGTKKER